MKIMRHITMNIVRQNIVRMMVLCMVMMCGAGSAWGIDVPYKVGDERCNTKYWDATSDEYVLDGDGSYHFVFVNHNPGSGDNWYNWILRVFNSSNTELLALRADNYGWGTLYNESGRSGNINWDNFMTNMNGAEIDMTVTRSGNILTMASTASKNGNKLWDYGYTTTGSIPDEIKLVLGVERAYLEITEANYKAPETPTFSLVDGGTYILKNVETGKFLAAGNSWGTQASLMDAPDPFVVTLNNGKYSFSSVVCNNDGSFPSSWNAANHTPSHANHYLSGTFCDGAATWFTVTPVGDNVTLTVDGANYLQGNGAIVDLGATSSVAASAQWQLYNIDDYALDATPNNPLNVTYYVGDGNFGRNNINFPKWHMVASNQNLKGGDNTNICAESYHSTFSLSQTLKNLPVGVYQLTAQGFYRQDGSDNTHLPYFYANEEKGLFPLKTGAENSMTDASNSFKTGVYTIDPIKVVVKDGNLNIGAKLETNTTLWCIWDNFQLTFLGQLPTIAYDSDDTSISVEMTDLPTNGTVYWRLEDGEFATYSETIRVTEPTTLYYKVVYSDGSESDVYSEALVFPATPELSADASLRISVDTSQKINVVTNSNGVITYTGYDPNVVAVSADGVVTAIGNGNTTVTVHLAATKDFKAASVDVPVVVPSEGVGSVKLLADIDFSNAISDGVVSGRVNSMSIPSVTPSFEEGYSGANTEVLRVGNGSATVDVDKSKIGERDVVTVSFDMYFGSLNNRIAGADLLDEEGNRIAGFYYSKYSGAITGTYDDFGMDWGKISSIGSSSSSNNAIFAASNKTTFTITLDYMLGTMSVVADNGQFGRQERSVTMTSTNPLSRFVLKSNYDNQDRRCWFDNLKIKVTEGDYTVEPAEYTVKYQTENGTDVKEAVVRKSLPGRIVTLSATDVSDFKNAGNTKKYIYVSDNASDVRIAEDGTSVITVLFREAAEYTWRLTTTVDTDSELPSGTSFEGDVMTVSYPIFIVDKQGNLYSTTQLSDNGKQYAVSFTPDRNDFEQPLEYTATGDKNVVFLSEAENIDGLVVTNNGGCATRTSSGRAAYAETATTLLKGLPSGSYVLTGFVYNNTNNAVHEMFVNVGDINIWSLRTNTNGISNATSEPFGIKDESTEITIPVCGGENIAFDLFYIRRVGEFAGDPVITKNLKSSYKVERELKIPMTIQADNAPWFKWYKWTADPETFDPETLPITDGNATLLEASKSNSYTYTGSSNGKEYIFAEVVGYGSSLYTHLAEVETIDPLSGEGAVTLIFAQDYNNATATDWIGSGNNSIGTKDGDKCTMISNTQSGPRASYIQLSGKFDNAPSLQNGTWILDYDFSPGTVGTREGNIQGFAIYNKALGMPTFNTNYAPNATNVFFGLDTKAANSSDYVPYLGGVAQTLDVTLTAGDWYHVHLEVTNSSIDVQLTNGKGRAIVYQGHSAAVLDTGMDLGGIHQFIPREGGSAYYDNIELKIKTNQPMVNSDLSEFFEGNDDYYLNEGEGLNFDVPAATEFEWYVSSVAPVKNADGVNAPRLNDDGSVTWNGHEPFMTVESPVGRATTTITKTNGVELSTSGKHSVEPAEDNEGKYAMRLKTQYPTVKTVWDEATIDNTTGTNVYRYYPEATASGSRWHYLRQLDVQNAEADHLDYVWCVAKNPLGEVTSNIAQINTYAIQPQIYLEDEYLTENANGSRADMTLPAIYKFRTHHVEIHAQNLIFNTTNMPVPYATRSYIHYKDEESHTYEPTDEVPTASTLWKYNDDVWAGVISTTRFSGFDDTLEANASVHGFYKSIPVPMPVDFAYGLWQTAGVASDYHDVTKGTERNSIAEYVIGPSDNPALQATQDIHFDYGRYTATEVELQPVSTKTTWDWSTLPERKFLTYNVLKHKDTNNDGKVDGKDETPKNLQTVNSIEYVVDPETGLGGPLMGEQYVMANFYGYGVEELGGFPSDKVKIGLEYVNNPTEQCMQGNAFIIKPALTGILDISFSTTDSGESRYLTLTCDGNTVSYNTKPSDTFAKNTATDVRMTITSDMIGKEVIIKACKSSDNTSDQYFRIYSATYTPDAKPVEFTEWKVKDRAVGLADVYAKITGGEKSDGYISLATETTGATIKYKVLVGNDKTSDELYAIAADIDNLNEEEQTYQPDAFTDDEGNHVGIHCRVNSTVFAWTEAEGMNRSTVTWHKTNAATYPVDLRFMEDFDTHTITTQDQFDDTYWGVAQSSLAGQTVEQMKANSTSLAPKAWKENAKKYGTVYIDGLEYTEANFEQFFITHGTTIDCYVNPTSEYKFHSWGAPSFVGSGVSDMMRSGDKAKHVHYHLLYDKAKAAATAGIAYLVANFEKRTEDLKAQVYVKESADLDDNYKIDINVREGDKIIAPVYHTAHKDGGFTVTHWTDDYRPADAEGHYEDYYPGIEKQIYEDALIKPVYRQNEVADNYRGRSEEMTATWWFTTDYAGHYAQPLTVRNEYAGFNMAYVTPVYRHQIGMAEEGADDDLQFDFPLTITPTATGRLDNTIVSDWCTVGRGTTFTMPACPGAEVEMEVRSKLNASATGTKFGGVTPSLIKVKYKGDADYTPVTDESQIDGTKTVESYIYKGTYTGDAETLDVVIGTDYSYIRYISLTLPVVLSRRDAALVTLDFSTLSQHLDMASLLTNSFTEKKAPKPYGEGVTGDGYEFDHMSENVSLYKTHYSKEDGAIYYDGVSRFMAVPNAGMEVPDSVPYVNGILGYTYSTGEIKQDKKISDDGSGTFIVGPFRSITHIRYKQGSSRPAGGGWDMTVGRMKPNWDKSKIQQNDIINKADDPRRTIPDFSQVQWSEAKYGSVHNSTTPEWVEMDIEEHIYPADSNKEDHSLIDAENFESMEGDIWLRFKADNPDVYLFAIEIYGIDPTSDQQAILETDVLLAENDSATTYEPTLIAGEIFHFPYLLRLDDAYKPESNLKDAETKTMQYNEGREVTLTANPTTGYDFLKWVKADADGNWQEVSRDNPYIFNINESSRIRAVFVPRGIINYTAQGTRFGIVPEPVQTNRQGGFTVAENRSLFAGEGQSLIRWQDTDSQHTWYQGDGKGVSSSFAVSTNMVSGSTPSVIEKSRGAMGMQIDVTPEFTDNTLELIDVVGRIGATARWQFGKKNGAPTMEGKGTTPRLVTQVAVTGTKDVFSQADNSVSSLTLTDTIDVNLEMSASINNAGRADACATVGNGGRFTIPATKGMKVEIGSSSRIEYSIDGGTTWTLYTAAFPLYKRDTAINLLLRNADNTGDDGTIELEYIQATYHQRAQKPVLSMQDVDVIGDDEHHATNNVQVQVQTNSNPTAVRYYTIDGSDPQYIVEGNTVRPTGTTRQVRGNYITINEAMIGSGTTLKVLSVCSDRADSEIATLDLEQYDKNLGLATYVYDSRIIDIHEDQIFKKLKAEHKGHFNLLSYDLNPAAAVIPDVITDHTTVFVASDRVYDHLTKALTDPNDPAAHKQTFNVEPLIIGTPLRLSWKETSTKDLTADPWQTISWASEATTNPATATSPATITYTEWMRSAKDTLTRVDDTKTYRQYYSEAGLLAATDGKYTLAFYDNMLLDGNKLCVSNNTSLAPEDLSQNGVQLVFNATELLTRPDGNGGFAEVGTFAKMLRTLMAPTRNPELIDIAMTYTQDVIDLPDDSPLWTKLDAPMLSALSDGKSEMTIQYLANAYPQFRSGTINDYGTVTVKNIEVATASDDLATARKLGAQGIEDLATVITLTNPKDPNFRRDYRIEYNIPLDSITFSKNASGEWVCNESSLFTITETKKDGQPSYKFEGPVNYGIKDVCFNGYAIAPAGNFDANGEIKGDLNADGTPKYSIWGRGEKFDDDDELPSPTAYSVTGTFIPEYPAVDPDDSDDDGSMTGLPKGQWMESHFPWGFKDCHRMAFTLLNISEYNGEIMVKYYHRQSEAPEITYTNIYNDMEVERNGEFVMEFNTVMHDVRVPGKYDDATVTWTAHIIPDDLGGGIRYGDIKDDHRKIDQYDTDAHQMLLTAEGGSNTLTFHYWHLEEGRKYWLHVPFHILRSNVGQSASYEYNKENPNDYEKSMPYTDYVGTDNKAVPYFDIPFTVGKATYNHGVFNYIVNSDNWWDAFKEKDKAASTLPSYAQWDGTFSEGIDEIKKMEGRGSEHPRFYMHVQKNLDSRYEYSGIEGKIQINAGNYSIVGEGRDSTLVYAKPDIVSGEGNEGLREGNNTATLHLDGDYVYIQDFTFENAQEGNGSSGQEYPAVLSYGSRNTFYNVEMKAFEESFASFGTLGYLERCKISGYGDFIVGSGDLWFEQCKLLLRDKNAVNLCAPATKATEEWGFVFNDCHIDREEGASNVNDHNWTLARPWAGYDKDEVLKSPAVTFLQTRLTVLPTNTGYGALDEGLRLRFHEYGTYKGNVGNQAPLNMRSVANCNPSFDSDYPVLTKEQADEYSIRNMFGRDNDGYDPQALTHQAKAPVLTNDGMVLHWKADPSDLCYLVYYLGDDETPDWDNAMMFCCVPGTDDEEAYCYLTNHELSPIFRTGNTDNPIAFSELWYNDMGKASPSRLWFSVRAANQMGGLSEMSNALMYHAARQYRTTITEGGVLKGDNSGNAYSTIYLNFQALAPEGVKAYALTDVSSIGGDDAAATTLTFTRVSKSTDPKRQDVVYADQGYLIYGSYGTSEMNHVFIETTSLPDVDLTSYFSGTVGTFLDRVSEEGLGEKNDVNDEIGWSISPDDYKSVPVGNVSAYTLQKYDDELGFYKYSGTVLNHHKAYLDTETAARVLMDKEGLSQQEAKQRLSRGMRILIDEDGTLMDVTSVFMDHVEPKEIYDLLGRRICGTQSLKPGTIYIIDGKKVLWKK